MRYRTLLAVLAWLTMALVGCSRSSSSATPSQINNLGIIEVSGGKPSDHVLSDGRICTVTPNILANGYVRLTTVIVETNASGIKRTTDFFEGQVGQTQTFTLDKNTAITVRLHNSK